MIKECNKQVDALKDGKLHRVALFHFAKKLIRVMYTLETKNIDFNSKLIA